MRFLRRVQVRLSAPVANSGMAAAQVRPFDAAAWVAFLAKKTTLEHLILQIRDATEVVGGLATQSASAFDVGDHASISGSLVQNAASVQEIVAQCKV